MAFDIAAIQYLYGANTSYNTSNNTYYLPTVNGPGTYWSCIWDAGGVDTISGQGATSSVTINLNNASLANNDPNAGGYISRMNGIPGGFTIANSWGGLCVVENAIGGTGHDTIIGNAVANSLSGGGGNDYLSGNAGNDYLNGGSGNDYFNGGAGNDAMYGGSGSDTLLGSSGNDRLVGYASGTEYDILTGGTGTDTFVLGQSSGAFYQGNGYATITDFNWVYDYFQVKGVASQYSLQFANWIGGASQDTAIYYGNDAISLVQDTTNVNFARDFIFV
jgi:serralysin